MSTEMKVLENELERNEGKMPEDGFSVSFENDKRITRTSVAELNSGIRAKKNRSYVEKEEMRKDQVGKMKMMMKMRRGVWMMG